MEGECDLVFGGGCYFAELKTMNCFFQVRLSAVWVLWLICCCEQWLSGVVSLGGEEWNKVRDAFDDNNDIRNAALVVGDSLNGRLFETEEGRGVSMSTVLETASLIKWVTGVVILTLVQDGVLGLGDNPQKYLDWWTNETEDLRSQVTIQQLLSFTSGFKGKPVSLFQTPPCISDETTTIDNCAKQIYDDWFEYEPGTTFYYGPSHHQIVASIAQAATGGKDWATIFQDQVAIPLDMTNTEYNSPSTSNPRISGGAVSTGDDIEKFLLGILRNTILNSTMVELMAMDGTSDDSIVFESTPIPEEYPFHYGASVWLECTQPTWDTSCQERRILSGTGAFGFHAWIDRVTGVYGVLAMRRYLPGGGEVAVEAALKLRPLIDEALRKGNDTATDSDNDDDDDDDEDTVPISQAESRRFELATWNFCMAILICASPVWFFM